MSGGPSNQLPDLELDNFEFLEPIGAGGMGAAYLAEQKRPRRKVAVKPSRGCSLRRSRPRAILQPWCKDNNAATRPIHRADSTLRPGWNWPSDTRIETELMIGGQQ